MKRITWTIGLLLVCVRYYSAMSLSVGKWAKHSVQGVGQIQEDNAPYFKMRFMNGRFISILKTHLEPAEEPAPDFKFPPIHTSRTGTLNPKNKKLKAAFTFEHMLERFMAAFPQGFADPDYLTGPRSERAYKVVAANRFVSELNAERMREMINANRSAEVCSTAINIASTQGMNLVNPRFEFPQLPRALNQPGAEEKLAHTLCDVLYGSDPIADRFNRYVSTLGELGASTWSLATIFQFLATRGDSMFMKITVSKFAADAVGIDLMYSPTPNPRTFVQLQLVANDIRSRLEHLGHTVRDGIDVQSFMFVAWNELIGEPTKQRTKARRRSNEIVTV